MTKNSLSVKAVALLATGIIALFSYSVTRHLHNFDQFRTTTDERLETLEQADRRIENDCVHKADFFHADTEIHNRLVELERRLYLQK